MGDLNKRTTKFKRSISNEMIRKIKASGWLDQYMKDKNLFFAIRDEYANFYYKGNSVLRISLNNEELSAQVHYKYLLKPVHKPEYVTVGEKFVLPIIDPQSDGAVKQLKAASNPYSGLEKEGVHKIIKANKNIVDVEISFSKGEGEQDRIDFCALRENGDLLELCFYECKHYSNKEIRAKGVRVPKVSKQLNRYKNTIIERKDEIQLAYENVFAKLKDESLEHPALNLMQRASEEGFSVSEEVRLVIFGFDEPQRKDFKSKHFEKLVDACGNNKKLVLMKGSAKDFKTGISS